MQQKINDSGHQKSFQNMTFPNQPLFSIKPQNYLKKLELNSFQQCRRQDLIGHTLNYHDSILHIYQLNNSLTFFMNIDDHSQLCKLINELELIKDDLLFLNDATYMTCELEREDDNGQSFSIKHYKNYIEALCDRAVFERRAHRQTYTVKIIDKRVDFELDKSLFGTTLKTILKPIKS